jgi:5-oxopent-3-ene-1,2,5-tricarboxylate decarboxylase/2-hydroxyhepta-2,4-diene-1,7-dioate isomerase
VSELARARAAQHEGVLFPISIFDALAHPHGEPVAIDAPVARWVARARHEAFLPPTRGTVYGVLLNHVDALEALGDKVHAAPYKAPPRAPVLYIKPRNTLAGHREPVAIPAGVAEVEIGATLGVVIGTTACRVSEAAALSFVAGYTVVNDLSIPHESYYRPSLRFKCRDGFCPIGPAIVARKMVSDPNYLEIAVAVDGKTVQRSRTDRLVRPVARLLADVTEFMTLHPGDVLMVGVAANAPRARAGQRVAITIEGVGVLETPLVAERER